MKKQNLKVNIVIVPPPVLTPFTDNTTGEEFIQWGEIFFTHTPVTYIGTKKNVENLYKRLSLTIPGDFDRSKTRLIKRKWLSKYFKKIIVKNRTAIFGAVIEFTDNNIIITEKNRIIYNHKKDYNNRLFSPDLSLFFKSIRSVMKQTHYITVSVSGAGNGFKGRSSGIIIDYGNTRIAVDPDSSYLEYLKSIKIHPDTVNAVLLTHNHEDHMGGMSSLLYYFYLMNKKIDLITTKPIFDILKKQLFYFKNIDRTVNLIPVSIPNKLKYNNGLFEFRNNHHVLPYGTLGFKLKFNGIKFGFSGDTKYKEGFAGKLKNKKLSAGWFEDCRLIMHEIAEYSPASVHTYIEDYRILQSKLKRTRMLAYHNSGINVKDIEFAEEQFKYVIRKDKIYKRKIN